MFMERLTICPYLKGNATGAQCLVVNKPIKDMQDVNIRICMSRRHEACSGLFLLTANGRLWRRAYKSVECSGI